MIVCFSFYKRLKKVREGHAKEDEKPQARKCSLAYHLAREWFQQFVKNADQMPNCATRTPLPALPKGPCSSSIVSKWRESRLWVVLVLCMTCGKNIFQRLSFQRLEAKTHHYYWLIYWLVIQHNSVVVKTKQAQCRGWLREAQVSSSITGITVLVINNQCRSFNNVFHAGWSVQNSSFN